MLWVDKYRPKTLDKVIVHQDVAQNLRKLVNYLFTLCQFFHILKLITLITIIRSQREIVLISSFTALPVQERKLSLWHFLDRFLVQVLTR